MPAGTFSRIRTRGIQWAIVGIVAGIAVGGGIYTFIYAEGGSYLTNDPAACANCHVMQQHFDAWTKSSHRSVAVCNDCHAPSDFIGKYLTKASNGFWHSWAFTTGDYPDPLRIKQHNRDVTENACRGCHEDIVAAIDGGAHGSAAQPAPENEQMPGASCIRCHATAGHWVR